MEKEILVQAGLTPAQAEIINFLYENKESLASEIAKKIKRSRAIVYKELEDLARLEIAEKIVRPNKAALFRAGHPSHLKKIIDKKEKELAKNSELLENYLPNFISAYNLTNNKPGVKFLEGEEGVKKILEDSLKSRTEIYLFINSGAVSRSKAFTKFDKDYIEKRKKAGLVKKIIDIDSLATRQSYKEMDEAYRQITQIKFMPLSAPAPFCSSVQIYDNKISYQIVSDEKQISILIEDKNIYLLHKTFFEYLWSILK